jgi:MtaA/CmuA family methyltransferase
MNCDKPYSERLQLALNHEDPGTIPIFGTITIRYIVSRTGLELEEYLSDRQKLLEAQMEIREDLGDWVLPRPNHGPFVETETLGGKVEVEEEQTAIRSFPIESRNDLLDLQVPDPFEDGEMGKILELAGWLRREVDKDIPIRPAMALHPFSLAYYLRGKKFFTDLIEDPSWSHELMEFATEVAIEYARAQEEVLGTEIPIFHSDDIAEMVSPEHYEEFALPYSEQLFENTEGWNVVHECGDSEHLWELFPDSTEVFELGPQENVDLREVRTALPNMALVGNLSTTEILLNGEPEDVRNDVRRCIKDGGREGLVLGIAGGVLPNVPEENLKALNKAVAEFG